MARSNQSLFVSLRGGLYVSCMVALLVLTNATQMVSLLILPFSRRAFRAYNRWAANAWWGLVVVTLRAMYGTTVHVVGDKLPDRENAILICNHQTMADIVVLFFLARPRYRLGDLKWFVKESIKYVPGIGWGMLFLGCLFVKRNWTADRSGIERTFATVISEDIPLWVISFSEGTRRTPEKAARSQEFAEKASLTPTEHVMIPRTKGFVATVAGLRSHCPAVYDVTIGYRAEPVPSLWQVACGVAKEFELHVRRHEMSDLPDDPEALSNWLFDRFVEKNDRMAGFHANGSFDTEPEA